jgi:hypothetical protein
MFHGVARTIVYDQICGGWFPVYPKDKATVHLLEICTECLFVIT